MRPPRQIMVVIFKNVNKNKNFFASPWKKIRRQEKNCRHRIFSSPEQNIVASSFLCRIFVDMSPSPEMYAPRLRTSRENLRRVSLLSLTQMKRERLNFLNTLHSCMGSKGQGVWNSRSPGDHARINFFVLSKILKFK